MNVPDTINDSRIRAIAEPYGNLIKMALRPDHQGAILEYTDANNAGKASMGLDGYEITPGRKLRIGTVSELLKEKAEVKRDKIQVGKAKKDALASGPASLQPSGPIRRPGLQGGRRGGLGQKRGLGFTASKGEEDRDLKSATNTGGKSNDDFREMLKKN
jgi:squamous cell carcinoma antigen recognized by T-cells 3